MKISVLLKNVLYEHISKPPSAFSIQVIGVIKQGVVIAEIFICGIIKVYDICLFYNFINYTVKIAEEFRIVFRYCVGVLL